jgi:hypothetical protein
LFCHLERLPLEKQARLRELMDKSNEGALTRTERKEITRLGLKVDQAMLSNSLVLARSLRPELFDKTGRPTAKGYLVSLRKACDLSDETSFSGAR